MTGLKKILKIAVPILTGLLIASVLMAVIISFGYTEAYASNAEKLTVKMVGLPIYELNRTSSEYTGTGLGLNMGIISGSFILFSFVVSGVISAIKKSHK